MRLRPAIPCSAISIASSLLFFACGQSNPSDPNAFGGSPGASGGTWAGGGAGSGVVATAGTSTGGGSAGTNITPQAGTNVGPSSGGTAGASGAPTAGTPGASGAGTGGGAGSPGAPGENCLSGKPTPAGGGANFPFPQNRFHSSCLYPTACNVEHVRVGWQNYKTRFIVDGGDGSLRVQRPEFSNDTVSEGIAYGMLFAVYMNDKETFDKIWQYARKYFDGNGLMHWQIGAGGNVQNGNSATDADEDMAFALIMADKQWGGYAETAKDFLGKVLEHDFHDDGTIRGGDNYDEVNPSYLAPAFYRTFASYTGDSRWMKILDKSYEILNGAANPTTGLVPDWSSGSRGPDYRYDAARTPYRIALDACWNNEPRAKAYADKIGGFFAGVTVANVRDHFTLDGQIKGEHHNSTFIATAAAATMVAKQTQFVEEAYAFIVKDLSEGTENYYNMSWAFFTALLMTGNFSDLTKP
jgi:endo-1,4-beta-D-glucanase Y